MSVSRYAFVCRLFLPESRLKPVFRHIQGVLSYIQQFEASFVKKEMEKANAERK